MPRGIVTEGELRTLLDARSESTELILTGVYGAREIWDAVDEVTELVPHKTAQEEGSKSSVDKENL